MAISGGDNENSSQGALEWRDLFSSVRMKTRSPAALEADFGRIGFMPVGMAAVDVSCASAIR
jgi:hypothetical protein